MSIENVSNLTGRQFEDLVEKLIQKMGFTTKERKYSADGGIDLEAISTHPVTSGNYIIQCKRYSKPIGVSIVRDLYGVVNSRDANKGLIITNSSFTNPALNFAKGKRIELINGTKFLELLAQYDLLDISEDIPRYANSYLILQFSLINPIKEIISKYEDYKNGLIYLEMKTVTLDRWKKIIREDSDTIFNYLEALENLFNRINEEFESEDTESIGKIQEYSKYIVEATQNILNKYVELIRINPPDNVLKAHRAYLLRYESHLEEWKNYLRIYEESKQNPPEDGVVGLVFDYNEAGISEFKEEVDKIIRSQNKPREGCFIVTAAYGTELSEKVNLFRYFRDYYLINSRIGKKVVEKYYRYSPFLANQIEKSNIAKKFVKCIFLEPVSRSLEKNHKLITFIHQIMN